MAPPVDEWARSAERLGLRVRRDVSLAGLSRWRIGGKADLVVEPVDGETTGRALDLVRRLDVPHVVIGDGSNLLFDDEGFRGVVVRIGRAMSGLQIAGTRVRAQAGIWVPHFARRVGCSGLTGVEHTVGIPGTLGGLVVMNGGSQRKGIGDNLVSVTVAAADGSQRTLSRSECAFAYRRSSLQDGSVVVLEAEFEFAPGAASEIRHRMIGIMADRRRKFPLRLPNCGSVFLSDPAMYDTVGPPGMAIEKAGLRGRRIGNAQIAELHGNFILNLGGASSRDVLGLIALARRAVFDRTGFHMDCEVRHVLPNGLVQPAHVTAEALHQDA